jgi:phosphate transport system ATP-binding protein
VTRYASPQQVRPVVRRTARRTLTPKIAVVIVTRNLARARRVADSTMFLYQGHMVEHGDTERVYEHPAHEETARYVRCRFG